MFFGGISEVSWVDDCCEPVEARYEATRLQPECRCWAVLAVPGSGEPLHRERVLPSGSKYLNIEVV